MLSSIYEKNLSVLKNIDIVLATKIIQASQGQSFELSIVSEKHHLYNIYDSLQETMMFDTIIDELKQQIQNLQNQSNQAFIYLFGMANAYALPTLLDNKTHKRIVIIEPELEILFVALHLYDFSDDLANRRLKLIHQKSFDFAQAVHLFTDHQSKHYARSFTLLSSANYYETYFAKEFQKCHALCIDALSYKIENVAGSFSNELRKFKHHIDNLPLLFESASFSNMIQQSKYSASHAILLSNIPNATQLQELINARAFFTLIAKQELLPQLTKHNLIPDIITALNYEASLWDNLTHTQCEKIILIVPSHQEHIHIKDNKAQTVFTVNALYKYFELKEHGYLLCDSEASILEIVFKLNFSHAIIYSHEELSLSFAYLSHLYKTRLHLSLIDSKPSKYLHAQTTTVQKLSEQLMQKQIPKKEFSLESSPKAFANEKRQNIKLSSLQLQSYTLLHDLENFFSEISTLMEPNVLVQKIFDFKLHLQANIMYQHFLYDFFKASSLLYFIEMAHINTITSQTLEEDQEKSQQWTHIHLQWFEHLKENLSLTVQELT